MAAGQTNLLRWGAWGQLAAVALVAVCWVLELSTGFLAACVGYLLVTFAGIVGIAKAESVIAGPLVYPFLLPGLVPLYYFATRDASQ